MKPFPRFKFECFVILLGIMWFLGAMAEAAMIGNALPNGIYMQRKVKSLKESRYKNLVRQKYDLSCGAASLATIMKYHYGDKIEEQEIIEYMLKNGDKEKITAKGFSLLDLKQYAEHRKYQAAGFKDVPLQELKSLKIPAIVLLDGGKYSHFVVLKGVKGDKAYIADPAFGNRSMYMDSFNSNWRDKIIFIVVGKNSAPVSKLNFDDALQAREMDVITIRQLGAGGGYATFPNLNEF
jgi:predicted double-glycine peptidase